MANIHDCLDRALEAGEIDRSRAEEAKEFYDQLVKRYASEMPRHLAEARAAADLKEASRQAVSARRHKVLAQLQMMRRTKVLIEEAADPAVALRNLVEYSPGSGFRGESVKSVEQALVKQINARLSEVLSKHGRDLLGNVRKKAQFLNIIRELHLQETGDGVAKEAARAIEAVREDFRRMFNAYGGDIGKLADYGIPHTHDAARLLKGGKDAWINEIARRLDWTRIEDHQTGRPFAEEGRLPPADRQQEFLGEIYDTITSGGWNTREPSMATGGRALYNQRADHRVLHFNSADDWMAYNVKFGASDPFSAMIGGLHGMARDVALMRVLGPNPRLGLDYAAQVAEKRVAGTGKAQARVRKSAILTRTMLTHQDGRANSPYNIGWARFFGGVRQYLTAAQLGSATLSAVTDLHTVRVAAAHIGMNANSVTARQMQLVASSATRETAARMGYVADTLANAGAGAARFLGDSFGTELGQRMSDFTMRASGLSYWTDMTRTAFQMEFAGFLAENAGRAFDAIDAPLRQLFQERGITPADWDRLRDPDHMFTAENGATFLAPSYWRESQAQVQYRGSSRAETEGLATRLQMLIEEQLEVAVPSTSLEARSHVMMNNTPGSIPGEMVRSLLMYKSFALSLTLNQLRRFNAIPTGRGKAAYAAKMSVGLVLLGAVAIQLKQIAKGRDPRPMDDTAFWKAAIFQGGGLGIFGDFFTSKENRMGGGFAQTLAGPVVGLADDIGDLTSGPLMRAANGENVNLGREVANFARYNTPVASSLWYQRLAFDRMVADQLQRFLDPDAERSWRRQERKRERELRNKTWWERGEYFATRAPDLSNALEEQ